MEKKGLFFKKHKKVQFHPSGFKLYIFGPCYLRFLCFNWKLYFWYVSIHEYWGTREKHKKEKGEKEFDQPYYSHKRPNLVSLGFY
jgi:hypothetical protein